MRYLSHFSHLGEDSIIAIPTVIREDRMLYIPRQEKASWGIPCNQSADGILWVGKGYQTTLESQFGSRVAADIRQAVGALRGDRCGRLWVNLATRRVTMAVGESAENEYDSSSF
jgi:hypothetical protein